MTGIEEEVCRDCGHILEEHDQEAGVVVGRCYICDCDGYVSKNEEHDEDFY